ncbi:MAG: YfhO family protein, partial [Clostridiales bacterium]|nr:YfhO family protein [Clostridiales bacterium]MDY4112645.1 YfhO family protein [Roseburia sp.]
MNKKIPLFAGFLIPLLIAVIVCIDHGVYPVGDQCILQVDMYHQYCPFFVELTDKMKNGGSIFFSWNIGLGADFVSLFAYYLASPLNLLLVLCPSEYIIEFMTILVLLKIAFSGFSFTYYLMEHFGLNEKENGAFGEPCQISAFAAAIFGCAYALSAFMAAYAWNIMWLDCMMLAPLAILGLERMVKTGNALLYYVVLALCIWSNFYIAIMICIFLVLWFLMYWLE